MDPKKAPMDVSIGFDNFEILKIDDRDFTVEINAYLIVKWKDARIIIDIAHVSYLSVYKNTLRPSNNTARYFFFQLLEHRCLEPSICINNKIYFYLQLMGANDSMAQPGEWIPVELELVDKIWLPDTEILRLKGFHSLEVLGRLQVNTEG